MILWKSQLICNSEWLFTLNHFSLTWVFYIFDQKTCGCKHYSSHFLHLSILYYFFVHILFRLSFTHQRKRATKCQVHLSCCKVIDLVLVCLSLFTLIGRQMMSSNSSSFLTSGSSATTRLISGGQLFSHFFFFFYKSHDCFCLLQPVCTPAFLLTLLQCGSGPSDISQLLSALG